MEITIWAKIWSFKLPLVRHVLMTDETQTDRQEVTQSLAEIARQKSEKQMVCLLVCYICYRIGLLHTHTYTPLLLLPDPITLLIWLAQSPYRVRDATVKKHCNVHVCALLLLLLCCHPDCVLLCRMWSSLWLSSMVSIFVLRYKNHTQSHSTEPKHICMLFVLTFLNQAAIVWYYVIFLYNFLWIKHFVCLHMWLVQMCELAELVSASWEVMLVSAAGSAKQGFHARAAVSLCEH